MNHDYISHESFAQIVSWMELDFESMEITFDRDEALDRLKLSESQTWSQNFLLGDSTLSRDEWGERVLGHLEDGF